MSEQPFVFRAFLSLYEYEMKQFQGLGLATDADIQSSLKKSRGWGRMANG